ncbi:serine/threonine-protein kinase pim-2-like [Danio aesculapii]|uniref:serine/threonine-protein kinase pim-2-like n=1 Tax=Danio aesculapii TaxID=1142201 RepID=UPI0024BF2549|nr:serine/threonine-protein kinase pim-2-like [Danio aesculapii]
MAQCLDFFILASLGSSSLMDMDLLSVMNKCASGCSVSSSAGPCSFSHSHCFISRLQSQDSLQSQKLVLHFPESASRRQWRNLPLKLEPNESVRLVIVVFPVNSVIMALKRKRCSQDTKVYDSHLRTPPTSSTNVAENHSPVGVGEEIEIQVRKKRRWESFHKPLSLYTEDDNQWMSSGQKRKRSCHSFHVNDFHPQTPPTSISSLQSTDVAEENERKRRRTDSPEKLLSCKVQTSSSSSSQEDQTSVQIHKKSSEGDILDRYELGEEIGEGGFGSVYEGKRLEDGLEVAVKIARKPSNMKYIYIAGHPEPLPLEIGLLILAHRGGKVPEIIELLDWQDQQDCYIMILERPSPCVDLFDFTMSLGSISERQAQGIMAQATMAGLMCCRRGVFHRDIKLENLLVNTDTLEVKLIDFGCGVLLQEFGYDSFCGTKEYFPPEYFLSNEYHAEPSTVWSLGVLLFLLLCQRFPEATDMQKINDGNWTEPGLSEECCHLIQALLEENPSQRIPLEEILLHQWFEVKE